jgi:hypothetical protein
LLHTDGTEESAATNAEVSSTFAQLVQHGYMRRHSYRMVEIWIDNGWTNQPVPGVHSELKQRRPSRLVEQVFIDRNGLEVVPVDELGQLGVFRKWFIGLKGDA